MINQIDKLKGGDLLSIGRSNEIVKDNLVNPTLFYDVFKGLFNINPHISARATNAIEKKSKINSCF